MDVLFTSWEPWCESKIYGARAGIQVVPITLNTVQIGLAPFGTKFLQKGPNPSTARRTPLLIGFRPFCWDLVPFLIIFHEND